MTLHQPDERPRQRPGERYVVGRRGAWSVRFGVRPALVLLAAGAASLLLALVGLVLGELGLSLGEVLGALGGRSDDRLTAYFVTEVRLPRVVTALVVGAALGVAGSLFQNITGNPLGSPDIIGFTTGAATGALVTIIVLGGDTAAVAIGAVIGGLATAAAVGLLVRSTGLTGLRLVLVGLGVGATLAALNTLLLTRASLVAAQTAAQWLAGSLNAVLWPRATVTLLAVAVLLVPAVLLGRSVAMLALGDDTAHACGVPVTRVRAAAALVGGGLVSVATAATGPIAFVALAAPQISRRLAGTATSGIAGPAVVGAAVVLGSDLLAQHLFAPTQLAVGVVTGALGGIYLIALVATETRRSR